MAGRPAPVVIEDPGFPPSEHLKLIYGELKERLSIQRQELDDLQRLVAIVLAANGAVLGLGAGHPPGSKAVLISVLFAIAIVLLGGNLVIGAAVLWPRGFRVPVEPAVLMGEYAGAATNVVLFDLCQAAVGAHEENESLGVRKWRSRLVRGQLVVLTVGALLLALALLLGQLLP